MGSVTIDRLPISEHANWAKNTQTVDTTYTGNQVAPPTAHLATTTISSEWEPFLYADVRRVRPIAHFGEPDSVVYDKIQPGELTSISNRIVAQATQEEEKQKLVSCVETYLAQKTLITEIQSEILRVQKP